MAEYRVSNFFLLPTWALLMLVDTLSATQAAEDALMRVYLTQTPPEDLQLPSSTFPTVQGNIYSRGREGTYRRAPNCPKRHSICEFREEPCPRELEELKDGKVGSS